MAKKPKHIVVITTADGRNLLSTNVEASRQLGRSSGGKATQAKAHVPTRFTSESGRAAINKRWAKHPPTGRGYRLGQRFVNRKPVKRQPLRDKYALQPVRGIQYSPALKVWFETDPRGTRPISESTALRKLGHLPRATDNVLPIAVKRRVR